MSTEYIQNVNTAQTVTTGQNPAGSNPSVAPSNTPIIDVELQRMLQELGIPPEQWYTMPASKQAEIRAQYAQIQREAQIAQDETGMGIQGLHVERTGNTSQPEQVTSQSEQANVKNDDISKTVENVRLTGSVATATKIAGEMATIKCAVNKISVDEKKQVSQEYKNILADAGIDKNVLRPDDLANISKKLSAYMKEQISGLSEEEQKVKLQEMFFAIAADEEIRLKDRTNLIFGAANSLGFTSDIGSLILEHKETLKAGIKEIGSQGTVEDAKQVEGILSHVHNLAIAENLGDFVGKGVAFCFNELTSELTLSYVEGVAEKAESGDPESEKEAKECVAVILNSEVAPIADAGANYILNSTSKAADALFGVGSKIVDKARRQDFYNRGIIGKDSNTTKSRVNAFIANNPTSKLTYDVVNNASAAGYHHKDAQVAIGEMVTANSKKHLNEEDAIQVHKDLYDAAAVGFDAENQDDIYKMVMDSGFIAVQEYAASNIYKLDESVRDWAEEYTKSLDIESVTNAIKTEPPAEVKQDTKTSDTKNDVVSASEDPITPQTIISHAEREQAIIEEFKTALEVDERGFINLDLTKQDNRDKLVELYSENPDEITKYLKTTSANNRKEIVVALCNTSKTTAISLACENPGLAILILSTSDIRPGIQQAVADKIILLKVYQPGSEVHTAALKYNNKYGIGKPNNDMQKPNIGAQKPFSLRA